MSTAVPDGNNAGAHQCTGLDSLTHGLLVNEDVSGALVNQISRRSCQISDYVSAPISLAALSSGAQQTDFAQTVRTCT
jgi:hypothetical protein